MEIGASVQMILAIKKKKSKQQQQKKKRQTNIRNIAHINSYTTPVM